ncbi:AAA family ATPase [Dinoroseobacter sp. PD6]|uniref:AAA family ATPase n=1 Tax=Dinoroseobacter sp. PD6 TaxID=3028384 RepID=UPI00237A9F76|nr:AAA family ATPase [Dinoroseobacter sp. PD6]MDD9716683.1 AAA family ATPase [Dinoroseobacter sp. PD6]
MDKRTPIDDALPDPGVLIVFGGLPGAGKSTIAEALAAQIGAVHLVIDRIEAPLKARLGADIGPLGYNVAYQVATSNLDLGHVVIADCVNPIAMTRNAWMSVAMGCQAKMVQVNIQCSDLQEHRRRVEKRLTERPRQGLPDWQSVQARQIDEWPEADLTIDTYMRTPDESVSAIVSALRRLAPSRFGADPFARGVMGSG